MIEFELAKKLQENNFPQNQFGTHLTRHTPDKETVYMPTLEELIEACGDRLINITNMGGFWQTNFKDGMAGETAGRTPSEAVARLWLELNKDNE